MKNSDAGLKRVLVVDDEPGISQVCRRILIKEGFEVDLAANGVEAEDKLGEREYDLILVDIRTPVKNGKELYQSISEKYPRLTDRVIFTTGDVIGGNTKGFLEKSGRPFLPKPFTPEELKAIVAETLQEIEANER